MAYVEVRGQDGGLIGRRAVEDGQAERGCRVCVDGERDVLLTLGESVSVGRYEVSLLTGCPAGGAERGDSLISVFGTSMEASEAEQRSAGRPDPPTIEGYEILGRLGQGGVWRAVDLSTKREVAIKFLRRHWFDSDKAKGRFGREVALAAQLTHPNIARVYASGLHQGVYYYVMELVDGVHLDQYGQQRNLSHRDIAALMVPVCDAVSHAHSLGIVHRDLKPSNILVDRDGQPHIVDFGLARMVSKEDCGLTLSLEGDVAGTPAYMAPEQAAGRQNQINERTDVYSLGAILYQLLTGHLPHEMKGGRYDVLKRIVEGEIRSPREHDPKIDRELESMVLTALARAPELRYPSVAALRGDMGCYLRGEALCAKGLGRAYRWRKRAVRLVRSNMGFVFLGLAAAAIVGVPWYRLGLNRAVRSEASMGEEVRWQALAGLPQGYEETRAAFVDGKMYVVGGRTGHGPEHSCVTTVQAYDPATNTWSSKAPLPAGRAAVGLVTLDGRLYALGGLTEAAWWGVPSDSVYRYDPRTDTWTTLGPMPIARSDFVAGVIGNKIYAAGGSIRWPNTTDRTDVYDPASESWSTVAPMPATRGGGPGGVWNGRLVLPGGRPDAHSYDRRIFVYEVDTNQWSQPASIPARMIAFEGTFLYAQGDCMYFAGCREGALGKNWIARLAPLTGQLWFLSPSSPVVRIGTVAVSPGTSHEIYLTGGANTAVPVQATEKAVILMEKLASAPSRRTAMDQESVGLAGPGVLIDAGSGGNEIQQGVTAALTGQLVKVELFTAPGTGTATLFINKGSPWQVDINEFSTTIRASGAGWFSVDVSEGKLCFSKGDRFVIGILGTGNDPWYLGTRPAETPARMWQQAGVSAPGERQVGLAFRTYVDEYVPSPMSP